MSDEMIIVDNVSKQYRIAARGYSTLREDINKLFRKFSTRNRSNSDGKNYIWALKDISFTVRPGEILGLVGPNGAGKTTILKILSKVTWPTNGYISTKGRVAALIELGAGFHPELTGRENIYLAGSIWGMKKKEIDKKFDGIVDFSGIEQFLDTPLKRYSSGMRVRLGFSVASNCDPDILLIDEVLAVGDFRFRNKCMKKMLDFVKRGIPMVMVSHDRHLIEKMCTKAILLYNGKIVCEGETNKVISKYYSGRYGESKEMELIKDDSSAKIMEIIDVVILGRDGKQKDSFLTGEEMIVQIFFKANAEIVNPSFYSRIYRDNMMFHGFSTGRFNIERSYKKGEEGIAELKYKSLNLLEGDYYLSVGITKGHFLTELYDAKDNIVSFHVSGDILKGSGMVYLDGEWKL